MRALDLFEGAGNATIGIKAAGYDVTGFEWNADACATSRAAGHRVVRCDLSSYPWRPIPGLDLVHGSPPCQPFSAAGDGAGQADERDGMPWFLRAVDVLRPPLVTVENVPGLTFTKHRAYFGLFLNTLRAYGYRVDWRVLNAADFGVPQTRERLIVVARQDDDPRWPAITHTDGGALFLERWVTMEDALGWGWDTPARTACGNGTPRTIDRPAVTVTVKSAGQWWRDRPATTVACDPRISPPGRHDPEVSGSQQAGAIRVTLPELARLQAFPDNYPFQGNRTSIARQIGNALPHPLIAAVVRANTGAAA